MILNFWTPRLLMAGIAAIRSRASIRNMSADIAVSFASRPPASLVVMLRKTSAGQRKP